jgi:hypothetical protein
VAIRQTSLVLTALGICSVNVFAGGPASAFRTVSAEDAHREIGGFAQLDAAAAMWVWTDKHTYAPNDSITVRWTVKPNGDLYPYTIVAYRQNNQTGARTYLPGNSSEPTDIEGNSAAQGFRVVRLAEVSKAALGSPLTAPNEPGMHTVVVQLRDYTGTRIVKSAYFKFGIVTGTEDLPSNITETRRLTNDKAYRIRGIVTVRNNAVLTIDPGTFLIGMPGSQPPSVLLISTAGGLIANGTRSRPIIMTSSQPIGSRQRGDWGGLILLGKAPLNAQGGELSIEGLPELPETRYGGTDVNHNCGSMRYVRVEFAGALLRPNEETNGITWGACGKETVSDHLQSHYGLDDAFEWFGGNSDAKYLVGTYTADDYVDVQIGYTGRIQHVIAVANEDRSNRGVEADNFELDFGARPLGKLNLWNATFIGSNTAGFDEADSPCLYFRRGAGANVNNALCFNWTSRGFGGANIPDSIQPHITSGEFAANGILMWDNGKSASPAAANTIEGQVLAALQPFAHGTAGQGRNFTVADPKLRRPLERSDPDFRPLLGSPVFSPAWVQPPDDGFYDQWATWIGAFGDVDWTEEWTTFLQEQDLKP